MLELSSLEQQCSFNRLVFLYKVVKGLVPAIPPNAFLKQQNLKDKSNKDSSRITSPETLLKGIVLKTISEVENSKTEQLKDSFFVKTVVEWNQLETEIVRAETVEGFKEVHSKCY